jgi:hypothetical protein
LQGLQPGAAVIIVNIYFHGTAARWSKGKLDWAMEAAIALESAYGQVWGMTFARSECPPATLHPGGRLMSQVHTLPHDDVLGPVSWILPGVFLSCT